MKEPTSAIISHKEKNVTVLPTVILKTVLLLLLVVISNYCTAQTINLNFEPRRPVIQLCFKNTIFYTDTFSLFRLYTSKKNGHPDYSREVVSLIRRTIVSSGSDTIPFFGELIPFTDSILAQRWSGWHVSYAIFGLINRGKITLFNQKGQKVQKLVKYVKEEGPTYIKFGYKNKDADEDLIEQTIPIKRGL